MATRKTVAGSSASDVAPRVAATTVELRDGALPGQITTIQERARFALFVQQLHLPLQQDRTFATVRAAVDRACGTGSDVALPGGPRRTFGKSRTQQMIRLTTRFTPISLPDMDGTGVARDVVCRHDNRWQCKL